MKRKIIGLLCIFLLVFLYACEYKLEETNFVQVKEPKELDYKMQLDISPNEKGEYVIKYGFLTYTSNLPDNIWGEMQLYGENPNSPVWRSPGISLGSNYYSFYNYWDAPTPGKYTLKCAIQSVRSNTGSLADLSGYEYLAKTFEWKIILQNNPIPRLNLRSERVDETRFKLVWNKPDPDYGEVDHYIVSRTWPSYESYNTNETFFNVTINPGYSYDYSVRIEFKNKYLPTIEGDTYIYNYDYNY